MFRFDNFYSPFRVFQVVLVVKNSPVMQETEVGNVSSIPGFWRRKWQPTPVFLPGESRGQGSLEDYSPWGRTESDMTKRLSTHT